MSIGGRNTLAPARLIDGRTLSPLSLSCIATLEETFGADYGTRGFDERATSAEALPVLVLMSMRRTRRAATLAEAADLVTTAPDARALRRWLLASIGYTFDAAPDKSNRSDRPEVPFNWWRVVRALRKRGLGYGEIGAMTLAQAVFELSPHKHRDELDADDAEREAEQAARAARAARKTATRLEGFDRACAACGMTPEQFAAQPVEEVARQIVLAWPEQAGKVNVNSLPEYLREYVAAKSKEQSHGNGRTDSADANGAGDLPRARSVTGDVPAGAGDLAAGPT